MIQNTLNKIRMKKSELKQLIREQLSLVTENTVDMVDTITMDVPLFLRMLEYAREEVTEDVDLHKVTELIVSLTKEAGILTMDDYDMIVGEKEELDEELSSTLNEDESKVSQWLIDSFIDGVKGQKEYGEAWNLYATKGEEYENLLDAAEITIQSTDSDDTTRE